MRLISKAAFGALALATAAVAAAPADAARVTVTTTRTVNVVPVACMRAPEFRPAFCFHHDVYARVMRREAMLREMRHERREAVRQAYLEHRYERHLY